MDTTQGAGGMYLYAVVPKASAKDFGEVQGVEQGKVYSVESGDLAAVVSDLPTREELRPERRLLSAHQQVLTRVTDSSRVVLPVSFGTIAEGGEAVRDLLQRYHEDLSSQMRRVEGKAEMGVRVSYAASKPTVFEFLVASNPSLRQARDQIAQSGREPTREEKIDLGQKVDAALSSLREEYTQRMTQALGGIAAESKSLPVRQEAEFVNLACLVGRDRQADFDAAVKAAAGLFPDSFILEQRGPYPPYDFVDMHIKSEPRMSGGGP
ncbi:MAG: GvpL/GvpF family gas vesicle protein [Deltaproteobacteria bacterium]|nr:GvpL/GvpF family gas vesicle protein [Deltaproteobacteria bacterium]